MRFVVLVLVIGCLGLGRIAAQDAKPQSRPAKKRPAEKRRQGGYLGLYLAEQSLGRRRGRVSISSVVPGSDAAKLGFKKGDVFVSVGGTKVKNGDHLIQLIWRTAPGLRGKRAEQRKDTIVVQRGDARIEIAAGMRELDVTPKVGDLAPNFELATPDGKKKVELSSMLGKRPVVLVFGSFT